MEPRICPECKFANKGSATSCAQCRGDFIIPNCHYHPEKKAETRCAKCQKPICFEDGHQTVQEEEDLLSAFLNICCCCLGAPGAWDTTKKEILYYCPDCTNNTSPNLQDQLFKIVKVRRDEITLSDLFASLTRTSGRTQSI
jgi:hypothetical protein